MIYLEVIQGKTGEGLGKWARKEKDKQGCSIKKKPWEI